MPARGLEPVSTPAGAPSPAPPTVSASLYLQVCGTRDAHREFNKGARDDAATNSVVASLKLMCSVRACRAIAS